MKDKLVLVQIDSFGTPLHIFRNVKETFSYPISSVLEMPRAHAVGSIRRQVFKRAGCTEYKPGNCEWCDKPIIWESGHFNSGEMHEVVPRGKGGAISVHNSVAICRGCHTGPTGAHGDRRWQTAKIKEPQWT